MIELQDRAEYQLNRILARLQEEGQIGQFGAVSYVKDWPQRGPDYDVSVRLFSGVFFWVASSGHVFHLDLGIIDYWKTDNNGDSKIWAVTKDREYDTNQHKGTYYLDTTPNWVEQSEEEEIMTDRLIYEKQMYRAVRVFTERCSSRLIRKYSGFHDLDRGLGTLSLDSERALRLMGRRRVEYDPEYNSRGEYLLAIEELEDELYSLEKAESISEDKSPLPSWITGFINGLKLGLGVKRHLIQEQVYLERFKDSQGRLIAQTVRNAPEIERLILWDSIGDILEMKLWEEVEERDYEYRTAGKKIKPYADFLRRKLGIK